MTKTYNDIEAVTRLLEEKEKDIELTARIGKELLAHNSKLESSVAQLESELRSSNEKIIQLSHELLKKSELIQILTNDVDDSGSEAGTPTGGGKPAMAHFETLQRRISGLEAENTSLRGEASRLAAATEDCEEHEAKLVGDLVAQLEAARAEAQAQANDAAKVASREADARETIHHLEAKLHTSDTKLAQVLKENDELVSMINVSRETQCELATELADLKEKYAEVVSLLEELRENLRKSAKKNVPSVRGGPLFPSLHTSVAQHHAPDSLAAELECSLFSELSLDSGLGASTNMPNYKRVFETVRCASRGSSVGGSHEGSIGGSPAPRLGGVSLTPSPAHLRTSTLPPFPEPQPLSRLGSTGEGGSDLEAALLRLTPAAVESRRAAFGTSLPMLTDECPPTPTDSILSSSSTAPWKLPDKLQIVKPLEGSMTLHHWSELATPSLGGLLEERPGVKIRGGTELEELGLQMYSLSDVEEDDEVNPGKSFQDTSHVYTYTNSTVMHPDDNTILTSSFRGGHMCVSATSSRVSSVAGTPMTRSRRNSTSTTSTTPGLAALLMERGIRAAVSAAPYSPTATPCNSPERSPSPEPDSDYSTLGLPGFLMTSGAEMLRRALGSGVKISSPKQPPQQALVRPDKKAALTGIRLVEKLERIGLEEILATTPTEASTLHQAGLRRNTRALHSLGGGGVLGVPGRPGRGELEARLGELPPGRQPRQVRPDLGSVPTSSPAPVPQAPLVGSLSSLIFGRKGGLL